jgi:hypothetical protein
MPVRLSGALFGELMRDEGIGLVFEDFLQPLDIAVMFSGKFNNEDSATWTK